MQQVVTTKQLSSCPTSLALNQQVIRHQLKGLLSELGQYVREFSRASSTSSAELTTAELVGSGHEELANKEFLSKFDQSYLPHVRAILLKMAKESPEKLLVIDPLLKPLFEEQQPYRPAAAATKLNDKQHSTLLDSEVFNSGYREPLRRFGPGVSRKSALFGGRQIFAASGSSLALKPDRSAYELLIQRGFKTKRTIQIEDETKSMFNISNLIKKSGENSFKTVNSLLSQPVNNSQQQQTRGQSLGSIFEGTKAASSTATSSRNATAASTPDVDNKIKIAFAEGLMFREAREEKKNSILSVIRFFVIILLIFVLMNSLSITTVQSPSNGKNGGINLRSLTGGTNFEVNPEKVTVRFDDVKGLPEAKSELAEIVDFLKDPEKYTKLGARLPKGVLLVGPPGCGKTLLAKSVAGEAGVPFFQASGSDFDEMFVGTGSKRVRQLFQAARAKAPCVIFIDEIDSVGSTRTNSAIHPHANQTINQLLAEMDGFNKNEGVIVLGATNRRETLDAALLRPGRFDVEVKIDKPDLKARVDILEYYLDKVARDKNIKVDYLARQLTGLGGSAIENVVNQAALRAVITNSNTVKMEHLEWALDRALMGYGKSRLADEDCNRNTAYHEAGHVLVAYYTKDSDPLHKVTILPRSQSLGHTAFVPESEIHSRTKAQLLARMDVAFGGRIAEELTFGVDQVTTGASSDYQNATSIAIQMIKVFGMSDKTGPRSFILDNGGGNSKDELSPQTQELLDQEIRRTLDESYNRAKNILKTHSHELKVLAEALLHHETLDADQIKKLLSGQKI